MFVAIIFGFISSSKSHEPRVLNLHNQDVSSFQLNTQSICECKAKRQTHINVFNSSLTVLPNHLLGNCERLDALNLPNNKIVDIKNNTFENLPEMNFLDLSLNQITILPRDVFKPLVALMTLELQGNQIQMIHSDQFVHNEYLNYLNLSNNSLKIIQPNSFRKSLYLRDLYVNDNHDLSSIDLFPENRTLVSLLDLSNCGFTQLYIPKNIRYIRAQFNKINLITAHPESLLHILEINNNNLTNLAHLPPLNDLKSLHMIGNPIKLTNFTAVPHFESLKWLSIDLNPEQSITAANMRTHFPQLITMYISSPDMSFDQQKIIFYNLRPSNVRLFINNDQTFYNIDEDEDEDEC